MTLRKIAQLAAVGILAVGSFGCSHTSGGIAPSNIPLTPGSYTPIGAVSGIDCQTSLLGLIPISNGNTTKDALSDALTKMTGTNALVNITSDTYGRFFVVVAQTCTEVFGTAVSVP